MRVLLGVCLVAICLAPVAGAVSTTSASADVTITVVVTDSQGDPVGDATVTVTHDGTDQTEETFSNGKALFDVPEGADVEVTATHPDLALNHPESVSSADGETEVPLVMHTKSTAVVTVETEDGTPIEDARVRLEKKEEVLPVARKLTASNGTVVVPDIEAGEYAVRVTRAGYYVKETTMVVRDRAGKTVTLQPGDVSVTFNTIDGHFNDSRAISASVVLFDGDERVGNISTGSTGSRTVSLDVNTQYDVTVKKPGYESQSYTLRTEETDASHTYAIMRTPSLSITPANTKVVTGQDVRVTVTDEYGEPVTGASIQVNGTTVAETDESGEALATVDREGDVEIAAVQGSLQTTVIVQGIAPGGEETTSAPETTMDETTTAAPPETTEQSEGIPGFGVVVAILAVCLSMLAVAGARRESS